MKESKEEESEEEKAESISTESTSSFRSQTKSKPEPESLVPTASVDPCNDSVSYQDPTCIQGTCPAQEISKIGGLGYSLKSFKSSCKIRTIARL